MSFFYLIGYKQDSDYESFFTLYDTLKIAKPNMVAVPLSKEEYEKSYKRVIESQKFKDTMKRVEFYAQQRNPKIEDIESKIKWAISPFSIS